MGARMLVECLALECLALECLGLDLNALGVRGQGSCETSRNMTNPRTAASTRLILLPIALA